jgi:hypothetical protein
VTLRCRLGNHAGVLRAFLLSDYGSSGAGADSPERATGARRWS